MPKLTAPTAAIGKAQRAAREYGGTGLDAALPALVRATASEVLRLMTRKSEAEVRLLFNLDAASAPASPEPLASPQRGVDGHEDDE